MKSFLLILFMQCRISLITEDDNVAWNSQTRMLTFFGNGNKPWLSEGLAEIRFNSSKVVSLV